MKIWVFYPPLAAMSGGCAVLLQIVRHLMAQGRLGGVLYWEAPPAVHMSGIPWVRAGAAPIAPEDMLLVPEGWPNALAFGFRAKCRTVIYCQNWSYLFHGLEPGVHWRDLPVDFLAVSDPVAWYLRQVLGRSLAVIRPAINRDVFYPPATKPNGTWRIGYMPRKNKALAEQIRRIFEERNPGVPVLWTPIHGVDQLGVAEILRSCHLFLVTGFPEGCPLPPLEAMACGCLCVGFSGFGGWDYMRNRDAGGFAPVGYALREVPWTGNGWWVADGDVLAAAMGLERALTQLQGEGLGAYGPEMAATVSAYSVEAQSKEVEAM